MNNRYYAVCGIVEIDGKILLVRHTYGSAKNRILLPGGYVRENELPTAAIEREVFEETGVSAKARSVMATQFKQSEWCIIFHMEYIDGEPRSDHHENSEVLLLTADEATKRDDITNLSREILTAYKNFKYSTLSKSDYVPKSASSDAYVIFGI